jgi:hypothetical protein
VTDKRSPYAAPAAKLSDPAPRPGSPYKAVGLGLLTDFGGTIAVSIVVAFVYSVVLAGAGTAPEDIEAALKTVSPDSVYFWIGAIGGGACSVLGGYVCARIAKQSEYTLGVILAAISVVLGLVLFGGGDQEVGMTIVLNAASVASVIVGAWLGKKRNRRNRTPQDV